MLAEQVSRKYSVTGKRPVGRPRQHANATERKRVQRAKARALAATEALVFPSPFWGGKRHITSVVWQGFGRVRHYIEPFGGSLAMLWGRPKPWGKETVNDADGLLVNLYRAIRFAPLQVAAHADWPVHELDLQSRSDELCLQRERLAERLRADPRYYDAELAGWILWGLSATTAAGFAQKVGLNPHPHISHTGSGLQAGTQRQKLPALLARLAARLARVNTVCGDWHRVVTNSLLFTPHAIPAAVFLDPPYDLARRARCLYALDREGLAEDVRAWAIRYGEDPRLRIALCGLPGEHAMPEGWTAYHWQARGGLKNVKHHGRATGETREEIVWLSPHCTPAAQLTLLA